MKANQTGGKFMHRPTYIAGVILAIISILVLTIPFDFMWMWSFMGVYGIIGAAVLLLTSKFFGLLEQIRDRLPEETDQ